MDAVNLAHRLGCEFFIGAGSQAEYGRVEGKLNAQVPTNPENGYGMAKLCAGQMSRVDSAKIASFKANEPTQGCVMASDAFFPFRDAVDAAAQAGITAIIQPGGSIRDQESIDAANEANIAMVFTGCRVFRHS